MSKYVVLSKKDWSEKSNHTELEDAKKVCESLKTIGSWSVIIDEEGNIIK